MKLDIRDVTGTRAMRDFHALPARLHAREPEWVPALLTDEIALFERGKNGALEYCSFACWVAYDTHGRPIGRIAGIINHRYNELRAEHNARFSHLDAIDDIDIIDALLSTVIAWARAFEMDRIIGPFGFTDMDPEGFMIDGFGEAPAIVTYCNSKFMVDALATLGWVKFKDYVVYKVPLPATPPDGHSRLLARITRHGALRVQEFRTRAELKPVAESILTLMNETYVDITGYSPLSKHEIHELTRRFMPLIDPRFVKVVFAGDTLVGFVIGLPDISSGFKRARGRLLPLGWWWILRSAKHAKRLDLLLGGIKKEYRGRGVDLLLGTSMIAAAEQAGFDHLDSHHELEENAQVRAEMERWGGHVYKRYRLFQRSVGNSGEAVNSKRADESELRASASAGTTA